ncbi:glutathione S-transferase family protein [Neotabrizicola sp. sgz301269]|uniref:glutathione S-transferase family protein n=1 Tax=Neotabrizicola sp. sgz301269 TaxID=3276282 RepID=UPI003770162F
MIRLYYYPDNASFAPHILLRETGLAHELMLVDREARAQKSAEYLRLNPAGRIPTLVEGDTVVFETPAVCIHIAEADPAGRFLPAPGDPLRPRFFQWMAYLNNTLQAEFMIWAYPQDHTTDPQGVAAIQAAQEARLTDILALLDRALGAGPYLLGERLTACDPFLFMLATWCAGLPRPPMAFPNLARFLRLMAQRPAVRDASAIEGIDLSAYL